MNSIIHKELLINNESPPIPLGLSLEEWGVFKNLIHDQRILNPSLQSQKLIRKVITEYKNIFPHTHLRTNKAQEYINDLRWVGLLGRKPPEKKVYTDSNGKKWQYMSKEEIINFFSSLRHRNFLKETIHNSHGIFEGFASFSKIENEKIRENSSWPYKCLPQTYATFVSICVGSKESLTAQYLEIIGFTGAMIEDILRPERSRNIASKNELLSPEVREFLLFELLRARRNHLEFRDAFTAAIRLWNTTLSDKHGFTLPIQINPYKSWTSICNILWLSDASYKTILIWLHIPLSIWKSEQKYIFDLFIKSKIYFLLQNYSFSWNNKNWTSLCIRPWFDDFDIIHGVFRFTQKGYNKFRLTHDIERIQEMVDHIYEEYSGKF